MFKFKDTFVITLCIIIQNIKIGNHIPFFPNVKEKNFVTLGRGVPTFFACPSGIADLAVTKVWSYTYPAVTTVLMAKGYKNIIIKRENSTINNNNNTLSRQVP